MVKDVPAKEGHLGRGPRGLARKPGRVVCMLQHDVSWLPQALLWPRVTPPRPLPTLRCARLPL